MNVIKMPALNVQKFNGHNNGNDRMKVCLCFYEPRRENEHWLNRLVAWSGKKIVTPVEIRFEDNMAASIFADDTVLFRKRSFVDPYYRIKEFSVSPKSYWLMYNYALSCAERQIPFSNVALASLLMSEHNKYDIQYSSDLLDVLREFPTCGR